jgi:hypothetical protein
MAHIWLDESKATPDQVRGKLSPEHALQARTRDRSQAARRRQVERGLDSLGSASVNVFFAFAWPPTYQ